MAISPPETCPTYTVVRGGRMGLPAGAWLIICWTVIALAAGVLASYSADTGAMDEFQLLASF